MTHVHGAGRAIPSTMPLGNMTRAAPAASVGRRRFAQALLLCGALAALGLSCARRAPAPGTGAPTATPVARPVPGFYSAAEAYFSPDGRSLVFNARRTEDDEEFHVYTSRLDGSGVRLINGRGADACSYFFPDGRRLVFTSTRDRPDLPRGNYSDIDNYPTGAELYSCALDGSDVVRLTDNQVYDAEVSVSPDGRWILFGRLVDGNMDLWRMRPDGTGERRVTNTPEWQEGGAFYLPDSQRILYRAWLREDQGKHPLPMTIFTIRHDGTGRRRITHDNGTNWAPHPSPDGRHFVFVKVLPPRNFEIFLGDLRGGEPIRVTHREGFDGFPAFAPDGRTIVFTSSRGMPEGSRRLGLHVLDIGALLD